MDSVDFRGAISSIKDGKLSTSTMNTMKINNVTFVPTNFWIDSFLSFSVGSGGDAHFYDDNQAPSKVRSNLSSNKDGDKVKGKRCIYV